MGHGVDEGHGGREEIKLNLSTDAHLLRVCRALALFVHIQVHQSSPYDLFNLSRMASTKALLEASEPIAQGAEAARTLHPPP